MDSVVRLLADNLVEVADLDVQDMAALGRDLAVGPVDLAFGAEVLLFAAVVQQELVVRVSAGCSSQDSESSVRL